MTDTVLMPSALTAENGAKALFMGEFHETLEMACPVCGGDGDLEEEGDAGCDACTGTGRAEVRIPVGWDTIKRIYAMAVQHLGAPVEPAK